MQRIVYLDNNATTQVSAEVIEAMRPYFGERYGNPSSMHSFGGNVRRAVEEAREKVAALINADPQEIVFTSCGTESDNHAVHGVLAASMDRTDLITSKVEHPAILNTCQALAKKGVKVTEVGVTSDGALNFDELEAALTDKTALTSIMWANNETGIVFPIAKIAEKVKEKGGAFHTDAVQVAGKIPIDVKKTPIDLLSISGHKLHAPKGIGALYIRKGTRIRPYLTGGHQEAGRRAGTENVPYIVGLGTACEMMTAHMAEYNAKIGKMRDRLESALVRACPDAKVNGLNQERLVNTANISFYYVEGESILLLLDEHGICASSGSACSSGSLEPSHVLRAMSIPFTGIHGSIRFSLSHYNTDADVDFVIEKLPPIIKRLREISPFGK